MSQIQETPANTETNYEKKKKIVCDSVLDSISIWKQLREKMPTHNEQELIKWFEINDISKKKNQQIYKVIKNINRHISQTCKPRTRIIECMILATEKIKAMIIELKNMKWIIDTIDNLIKFIEKETSNTVNMLNLKPTKRAWMELTKQVLPTQTFEYFIELINKGIKNPKSEDHGNLKMSISFTIEEMGLDIWDMCHTDEDVKQKLYAMLNKWIKNMLENKKNRNINILYAECVDSIIRFIKNFMIQLEEPMTHNLKNIMIKVISGSYFEEYKSHNHDKKVYHILNNLVDPNMSHDWLNYYDFLSDTFGYGKKHRVQGIKMYENQKTTNEDFLSIMEYVEMMASESPRIMYSNTLYEEKNKTIINKEYIYVNDDDKNTCFGWIPYWFIKHPSMIIHEIINDMKKKISIVPDFKKYIEDVTQTLKSYPGNIWVELYFPYMITDKKTDTDKKMIYSSETQKMLLNLPMILSKLFTYMKEYNILLENKIQNDSTYVDSYKYEITGKNDSVYRLLQLIGVSPSLNEFQQKNLDFFCKIVVHHHLPNIVTRSILKKTDFNWKIQMDSIAQNMFLETMNEVKDILFNSLRKRIQGIPDIQLGNSDEFQHFLKIEKNTNIDDIARTLIDIFVSDIDFGTQDISQRLLQIKRDLLQDNIYVLKKSILKKFGYYPFIGLFTITLQKQICFIAQMFSSRIESILNLEEKEKKNGRITKGLNNYLFETMFTKITIMTGLSQPLECYSSIIPMIHSGNLFGFSKDNKMRYYKPNTIQYKQSVVSRYTTYDLVQVARDLSEIIDIFDKNIQKVVNYLESIENWNWDKKNLYIPQILFHLKRLCDEYKGIENSIDGINDVENVKKSINFYNCKWLIEKCDAYVFTIHHIMDLFSVNLVRKYNNMHDEIVNEIENIQEECSNYGYLRKMSKKYYMACNFIYGPLRTGSTVFFFNNSDIDQMLANYFDILITENKERYPKNVNNINTIFHIIMQIMTIHRDRNVVNIYNNNDKKASNLITDWGKVLSTSKDSLDYNMTSYIMSKKNKHERSKINIWWDGMKKFIYSKNLFYTPQEDLFNDHPKVVFDALPHDIQTIILSLYWWKKRIQNFFDEDTNFFSWLSDFISIYISKNPDFFQKHQHLYDFFNVYHGGEKRKTKVGIICDDFHAYNIINNDKFISFNHQTVEKNDFLSIFISNILEQYVYINSIIEKIVLGKIDGDSIKSTNIIKFYPESLIHVGSKKNTRVYWDLIKYLYHNRGYIHPILIQMSFEILCDKSEKNRIIEVGFNLRNKWSLYMNFLQLTTILPNTHVS
ncbi:hypothetical protein EON71_00235 [bacterium]|nr:MAG: hypothetical protein EON71_00235 [bacterium]